MNPKFFPVEYDDSKRNPTNLLSKMDQTLIEMNEELYPNSPVSAPNRISMLSVASSTSYNSFQQNRDSVKLAGVNRFSRASRASLASDSTMSPSKLKSGESFGEYDQSKLARVLGEDIPTVFTTRDLFKDPIGMDDANSLSKGKNLTKLDSGESNITAIPKNVSRSSKALKTLGVADAAPISKRISVQNLSKVDSKSSESDVIATNLITSPKALKTLGCEVAPVRKRDSVSRKLTMNDIGDINTSTIPAIVSSTSKALKTLGIKSSTTTERTSISRNLMNLFTSTSGGKRGSLLKNNDTSLKGKERLSSLFANTESEQLFVNVEPSNIPRRRSSLAGSEQHNTINKKWHQTFDKSEVIQEATPSNSDTEEVSNFPFKSLATVAHTHSMRKFVSGYLGKTPVLMNPPENSFFVLTIEGLFEFEGHEDHHRAISVMKIDKFATFTIPNQNGLVIQVTTKNGQKTDTFYLTCPGKSDLDVWTRGLADAISLAIYSQLSLPPSPKGEPENNFNGDIATLKRLASELVPISSPDDMNFVKPTSTTEKFAPSIVSALSILKCLQCNKKYA
jgi:hypothetical protein